MSNPQTSRPVSGLVFVIIGTMFNTLGIALFTAGWVRYVLMGVGLAMILFGLLTLLRARTTS